MRCTFCATGKGGFARNLAAHEILDQVLAVSELHGRRASNVGEPRMALHMKLKSRSSDYVFRYINFEKSSRVNALTA
jgi:23S rRNA (adenine2503-C2)-methyltransferase